MIDWTHAAFLGGRLLFGGFFLWSGLHHFTEPEVVARMAASQGVPLPMLAAIGTGVLLFLGGFSALTGILPRIGLAMIVVFLAGVTPVMHAFWTYADPSARALQLVSFSKNVALLGAALALLAIEPPWPVSVGRLVAMRVTRAARV